jgi:hypothetical protein
LTGLKWIQMAPWWAWLQLVVPFIETLLGHNFWVVFCVSSPAILCYMLNFLLLLLLLNRSMRGVGRSFVLKLTPMLLFRPPTPRTPLLFHGTCEIVGETVLSGIWCCYLLIFTHLSWRECICRLSSQPRTCFYKAPVVEFLSPCFTNRIFRDICGLPNFFVFLNVCV